ncbi:MAG: response regulator transcription factor [Magnetococcales bacterium]|nr:response regulator transcription factor [Magnetococcales bacterium]
MRILYAEDETSLAETVKLGLERDGFAVDLAPDGEEALFLAENCPYDLVLLDRMMPKVDGFAVLQHLRKKGNHVPVIMLTALGSVEERVECLQAGADDYLSKPFSFRELLARIRAVLRRHSGLSEDSIAFGGLSVDFSRHRVTLDNQPIELTTKEFSLLEYLIHNRDRVITRTELVEHLYDETFDKDSNLIDVFIHKLRRKTEQGNNRRFIQTVRGTGYLFSEELSE